MESQERAEFSEEGPRARLTTVMTECQALYWGSQRLSYFGPHNARGRRSGLVPPFYKIRRSPEGLREMSEFLWQESESGFKPRSDSQCQALKNEDFFLF